MQRLLLEPLPPPSPAAEMVASYLSASDAAHVGGDLYDAVAVDGGVRLVVADVQGKGLPAVRVASVVLGAFRESAPYLDGLPQIGERIERALARRTDGERFVTGVLAEVRDDGSVEILNYGHPPPPYGAAAEAWRRPSRAPRALRWA
ncbi:SpoIIE family protein phosphatase [Streptomyces sp. NPDC021224]|uniref:SpoIIE family protein phosphatase n=1 Tax=unclassified Streptomyces TaxID=2593676 RepID=UPI00378CC86A